VYAARLKDTPDLCEERGHRITVDVLEYVGVVDGVDALGRQWDAFPKIVDKDLVHADKRPPPLLVEE
jgi:hypothetical protein